MSEKIKYNSIHMISRFILSLFLVCSLYSNANSQNASNSFIELNYGSHETFDRFVFQFQEKPEYEINNDEKNTTIKFSKNIDIKSKSLSNYSNYKLIRNIVSLDGELYFIIPTPLIKKFEYQNKIVVDVAKEILQVDKKAPQASFKIDEIKVLEDDEPIEVVSEITASDIDESGLKPIKILEDTYENEVNKIQNNLSKKSASLSFSWNDQVGLAAFKRNEYLWIVFDKVITFNASEIAKTASGFASEILQIPNMNASILRLKLRNDVDFAIRKEGLLWIVDLFNQKVEHKINELDIVTKHSSRDNIYLFVPTTQSGNVVLTFDPDVGDILMIATTYEANSGLPSEYEYADFNLFATMQGFVVEPFTDDISLTRNNSGLIVKAIDRGLNISPNLEALRKQSSLIQRKDWIKPLAEDLPTNLMFEDFILITNELMSKIASLPEKERNIPRLELARYYIAKGMAPEAAGILQTVIDTGLEEANEESAHGLLGIAYFINRKYDEAIKELSYGRMKDFKEAVFWVNLCKGAQKANKESNDSNSSYLPIIRGYPLELKTRVAMVAAQTAIRLGDDLTAQSFIDMLKDNDSKLRLEDFVNYSTSEVLSLQGYSKESFRLLAEVSISNSSKYSALARNKIAITDYRLGLKNKEQTISELEKLKYVWGEKAFKLNLLEELFNIYISTEDYYSALSNMQTLADTSDFERREKIIDKMVTLFENIFIHNQDAGTSPIKALALFNDFEWLTTKSSHYSEIVINLSDRLVYVDLLDRAANLLEKYIDDTNISSFDRAQIGTRLALIHIFNNNSDEALEYLDKSESNNLPDLLKSYRKIVRARALYNLKKYDEVIELLKNDNDKNAIFIKTDTYLKTNKWDLAANEIKKLIKTPKDGEILEDEQASLIIDWITALKKAKKDTLVIFARDKFLPHFKNSKYYSLFNVLTNNFEQDEIDIKNINQFITDVDNFSNFAKSYNESLSIENFINIKE